MKHYEHGYFNYTTLWFELECLRLKIKDMNDDLLIEEVAQIRYHSDKVDDIIMEYYKFPYKDIPEEDREYLIWFYVTCEFEDWLEI